jgi:hypothetical protein
MLIDGVDPYAQTGTVASVSCRIYRDEHGQMQSAPSVAELCRVLLEADNSMAVEDRTY